MSVSVASSAGIIFSAGNCGSHSGARKVRITSQRFASSRLTPTRARKSLSAACSKTFSVESSSARHWSASSSRRKPKLSVQVGVVRRLELLDAVTDDVHALRVEGVQMLLGQLDADAVDALTLVAVGLVRHRRPQHPEGNRLTVYARLQARFQPCDLLRLLAGEIAQVTLGREAPELADSTVAVCGLAERLRLLETGELGVALVDRRQLERPP